VPRNRKYVVPVKVVQNPHGVRIPLEVENPPWVTKDDLREVHKMLLPANQLVSRQGLHPLVVAQNAKLDIPIGTGDDPVLWPPRFIGPDASVFDDAVVCCFACHSRQIRRQGEICKLLLAGLPSGWVPFAGHGHGAVDFPMSFQLFPRDTQSAIDFYTVIF